MTNPREALDWYEQKEKEKEKFSMNEFEKEAERLFGKMRDATPGERKQIKKYIDSISEKIEVNFDDMVYRQDVLDALGKDIMGGLNYRAIVESLPSAPR